MERNSYFTEGFILGIVAGAITGLLCAPSSGKKTRAAIKNVIDNNGDPYCENGFLQTKASVVKDQFNGSLEELILKTKKSIEDGIDVLSKRVEKLKKPDKS